MTEVRRVAIVGAGPAGLVAAIAAKRLGLAPTVYERADAFGRVGGGILLHSNGLRVLDALGLLEDFERRARLTQVIRLETPDGRALSTFDYRKLDVPENRCGVVLRSTLLDVLAEGARREGVEVRLGRRCASVERDETGVRLAFEDGAEAFADVALACDGINSRVREAAGLRSTRRAVGEAYLRGVVRARVADDRIREIWGTRGRRFGVCPLADGDVYFYCNAPLGGWRETLDHGLDAFVESWRDFGAGAVDLLRAVSDWERVNYSELHEVVLDRWHDGRVVLVGDAAHAMTPNLGQGANSAMVDALVLARLLASERFDAVGLIYESVRKPFVTKIQDAARRVGRLASWASPPAVALRTAALSAADRFDALARPGLLLGAGYNAAEQAYYERL